MRRALRVPLTPSRLQTVPVSCTVSPASTGPRRVRPRCRRRWRSSRPGVAGRRLRESTCAVRGHGGGSRGEGHGGRARGSESGDGGGRAVPRARAHGDSSAASYVRPVCGDGAWSELASFSGGAARFDEPSGEGTDGGAQAVRATRARRRAAGRAPACPRRRRGSGPRGRAAPRRTACPRRTGRWRFPALGRAAAPRRCRPSGRPSARRPRRCGRPRGGRASARASP